ncbi:MAG: HEAT repeat domain-containing protein [Myxococcales bacterium]|nr:HEAT repeat domain-containing protein [Myxococcales bacterium]
MLLSSRTKARWCALVVLAVGAGCGNAHERGTATTDAPPTRSADEPPDEPEPPRPPLVTVPLPPLRLAPTGKLVARSDLAAKVDALAAASGIESSHIGAAGAPSKVWPLWDAVLGAAKPEELVALLGHESPVVRGYVARHAVTALPDAAQELLPLFGDGAQVATVEGCSVGTTTLASLVLEAICYANGPSAGVSALLLRAAEMPGTPELAQRALGCAARHRVAGVAALAKRWVASKPSPEAVVAALAALASAEPEHACETYTAALRDRTPAVRRAALTALAKCSGDEVVQKVERLLDDPDRGVARTAAQTWLELTKGRPGPKLRLDHLECGGGHSPDSIKGEMAGYTRDVAVCFHRAAQKKPSLRGSLLVKWTIDQTGLTMNPTLGDDTVGDPTVEACILASAAGWKFRGMPNGAAGLAWALAGATFVFAD